MLEHRSAQRVLLPFCSDCVLGLVGSACFASFVHCNIMDHAKAFRLQMLLWAVHGFGCQRAGFSFIVKRDMCD